jgi:hypothetical protein
MGGWKQFSLKLEVEERFIAQKTCDGKPYLHSGTAKDTPSLRSE